MSGFFLQICSFFLQSHWQLSLQLDWSPSLNPFQRVQLTSNDGISSVLFGGFTACPHHGSLFYDSSCILIILPDLLQMLVCCGCISICICICISIFSFICICICICYYIFIHLLFISWIFHRKCRVSHSFILTALPLLFCKSWVESLLLLQIVVQFQNVKFS